MPGDPDWDDDARMRWLEQRCREIEIRDGTVHGIRSHRPMSAEDVELAKRVAEAVPISPEQIDRIKRELAGGTP